MTDGYREPAESEESEPEPTMSQEEELARKVVLLATILEDLSEERAMMVLVAYAALRGIRIKWAWLDNDR